MLPLSVSLPLLLFCCCCLLFVFLRSVCVCLSGGKPGRHGSLFAPLFIGTALIYNLLAVIAWMKMSAARRSRRVRGHSLAPCQQRMKLDRDILTSFVLDPLVQPVDVRHVLDDEGHLTTREVGVKRYQFARLSLFHTLRSLPWSVVILYSMLLYLIILLVSSTGYFLWSIMCGAREGTTWMTALYFTVVSLAANGGYSGEHLETMMRPGHVCFAGRTIIVMLLSYTNIIFVGIVAALVVGKAECGEKLGRRIVFSDFCSLTAAPGIGGGCWKLTFRMANSMGHRRLVNGCLRVFLISTEKLRECRRPRKLRRLYRPEFAGKMHAKSCGGTDHGRSCDSSVKTTPLQLQETGLASSRSSMLGKRSTTATLLHNVQEQHRSGCVSPNCSPLPFWRHDLCNAGDDKSQAMLITPERKETLLKGTTAVDIVGETGKPCGVFSGEQMTTEGVGHEHATTQKTVGGYFSTSYRPYSSTSINSKTMSRGDEPGCTTATVPIKGKKREVEPVHIRVQELLWVCPEERHLDVHRRQLSMWFPVNITHIIDRRSPLYQYIQPPGRDVTKPATAKRQPSHTFQLVATFDATELDSGATITAKRTYTASDIVPHYRFSNKLMHVRPGCNEVFLDYHHFNEILPTLDDSSAMTDSDASGED